MEHITQGAICQLATAGQMQPACWGAALCEDRWMHPSSLTLRRDKACDKVGFCDDPPWLKFWGTQGPDQARPTRRARQFAFFAELSFS